MITITDQQASHFAWPGSQLYVFYSAVEKHPLAKTHQMECITISAFSVFVGHGHKHHVGAGWERRPCLRDHAYFPPSHLSLIDQLGLHMVRSFPFDTVQFIQPKVMMTL